MRVRTTAAVAPALAGLVLLSGCVLKRSKSAEVFVLEPVAAQGAAAPQEVPLAVVGVLRVTVPGWIDRPQIVTRAAGSQIVTDEFARWGEPIARGVQRVVAENLAALMPQHRVVRAPFRSGEALQWRVDVALSELARQADGSVRLEALYTVLGKGGEVLLQRRASHTAMPAAVGARGAATGASEALAALSRDIAEALLKLP